MFVAGLTDGSATDAIQQTREDPADIGERLGQRIAGAVGSTVSNIGLFFVGIIPGGGRVSRGLLKAGYKGLSNSSGADVIGHIIVGNTIKHVPLRYNHEREQYETMVDDDPEHWETSGEYQDRYSVFGSTGAVFASSQSNDVGDHVQAEVHKAFDLGRSEYLYENAQVNHTHIEVTPDDDGQALADGGETEPASQYRERVSLDDPGSLADELVDLGWGSDVEGRVVSASNYWESYPRTPEPEKHDQQRQIGRFMERDSDAGSQAFKFLLVAGAIVVGSLLAVFVIPELMGGGGSGSSDGGGIIPLTLSMLWSL
jgi:hypothetical protein